MRILFLATNPEVEASTRYRVLQYFPALRAAGHVPELVTFFSSWVGRPTGRAAKVGRIVRGLAGRARALTGLGAYDLTVVHREILPHSLNYPIDLFAARKPVVFDFDDAVWLPPPNHGTWAPLHTTRRLVDRATRVFAGNSYLAEYARQSHDRVDVVPTVVDTTVYRPDERPIRDIPVIGWIGSPTTAPYLSMLTGVLGELARTFQFRLRVIGGRPLALPGVPVETIPWSLEAEAAQFRDLDIGLYPLTDDVWSQGKCGFKAIQYLASGVPAVVSSVGVVREIVENGRDGLWATTPAEWKAALARLLSDPAERRRLATNGRRQIETRYSLAVWAPRFIAGLEAAARGPSPQH
jgi:glycosyltransferase involved in cell wall biosynthesis